MDAITQLLEIDFAALIVMIFIVIFGINSALDAIGKISVKIGKPIGWVIKKNEDHELILQNANTIKELSQQHKKDTEEARSRERSLETTLATFMDEMRHDIKTFTDNRKHDREQSFQIQKELTNSMKTISDTDAARAAQIMSLMDALKELLAGEIDNRYKRYLNLQGIPEDEYDEFVSLHQAYKGVNGNHHGDQKYEYCINHLRVIPVESKLKIEASYRPHFNVDTAEK